MRLWRSESSDFSYSDMTCATRRCSRAAQQRECAMTYRGRRDRNADPRVKWKKTSITHQTYHTQYQLDALLAFVPVSPQPAGLMLRHPAVHKARFVRVSTQQRQQRHIPQSCAHERSKSGQHGQLCEPAWHLSCCAHAAPAAGCCFVGLAQPSGCSCSVREIFAARAHCNSTDLYRLLAELQRGPDKESIKLIRLLFCCPLTGRREYV